MHILTHKHAYFCMYTYKHREGKRKNKDTVELFNER